MAAWCLPKSLSSKFLDALKDGTFSPERLMEMSSDQRRAEFAKILGDENAHEVNAQFESKLLLKNQQAGLVNWAKKLAGITEPVRKDIIASINKLDRVLQPEDEEGFLADLAAKKLGVSVTADEAKQIFELSQTAAQLRAQIEAQGAGDYRTGWTVENGTAYGNAYLDLRDKINSLKPHGDTFAKNLFKVINIPREALTSLFHLSAPFVQLWGQISTKQWWNGLGKMFQYLVSEDNYRDLEAYIFSHPDYEFAKDGKLGLTNLGDKLTQGEEALQTHLLSDAHQWLSDRTGVPNFIRGSQRSFVGVINYVRFERFVEILNAARLRGEDVGLGSKTVQDIASAVNNFTGRGPIGLAGRTEGAVELLNAVFFAPRKLTATFQMFNPVFYARLTPVARVAAMRQLAGSLLITGAMFTLAKFSGAQVDMDPRSSDFAKINIGAEKLDMTGGNASYLRFLARIVSGQEVTASGKVLDLNQPRGQTRGDVFVNFVRGKLSPIGAIIANALYGKDPAGRAFSVSNQAYESLTPIVIHSWIDFATNNPGDTAAIIPALSSFLGVGLESPLPPISESGRDVWGDPLPPLGTPKSWRDDPVNQEAQRVGLYLDFPAQKINGIPLTHPEYDQYCQISGRLAHQMIEQLISMPSWSAAPSLTKLALMKSQIREARKIAADGIMAQNQGGPHDILKLSHDAKMAALGLSQ